MIKRLSLWAAGVAVALVWAAVVELWLEPEAWAQQSTVGTTTRLGGTVSFTTNAWPFFSTQTPHQVLHGVNDNVVYGLGPQWQALSWNMTNTTDARWVWTFGTSDITYFGYTMREWVLSWNNGYGDGFDMLRHDADQTLLVGDLTRKLVLNGSNIVANSDLIVSNLATFVFTTNVLTVNGLTWYRPNQTNTDWVDLTAANGTWYRSGSGYTNLTTGFGIAKATDHWVITNSVYTNVQSGGIIITSPDNDPQTIDGSSGTWIDGVAVVLPAMTIMPGMIMSNLITRVAGATSTANPTITLSPLLNLAGSVPTNTSSFRFSPANPGNWIALATRTTNTAQRASLELDIGFVDSATGTPVAKVVIEQGNQITNTWTCSAPGTLATTITNHYPFRLTTNAVVTITDISRGTGASVTIANSQLTSE